MAQRHTHHSPSAPTAELAARLRPDHPMRANPRGRLPSPPQRRPDRRRTQITGRTLSLPTPLIGALLAHRQTQDTERTLAAELWQDGQWVFTQPTGRPIDPRADHAEWKALLAAAGVRDARLHDARHTAATMLLVLNVPSRTVMDLMGWSQLSMTQRHQHVPDQLRRDVADKLGRLLWASTNDDDGAKDDGEGGPTGVLVPA